MIEEKVYWAELQSTLSGTGLNISVGLPKPGYPWFGEIDGKPFGMTISPKNKKDGMRDFVIMSLYGQDETKIIPLLSSFMGYEPFCKYLHKKNASASATYEWDKNAPEDRVKELKEDADVHELQEFEEGFQPPSQIPGTDKFFQQFTPEIVENWERAVQKNPDAEWGYNKMRSLIPFLKRVMPRIGKNQSLFGLSIISLDGKSQNEKWIVRYGLEPLLKAQILTQEEVGQIVVWYEQTDPTWDSGGARQFQKEFEIDEIKYRLITDSYRNCRDLNLQVLT